MMPVPMVNLGVPVILELGRWIDRGSLGLLDSLVNSGGARLRGFCLKNKVESNGGHLPPSFGFYIHLHMRHACTHTNMYMHTTSHNQLRELLSAVCGEDFVI